MVKALKSGQSREVRSPTDKYPEHTKWDKARKLRGPYPDMSDPEVNWKLGEEANRQLEENDPGWLDRMLAKMKTIGRTASMFLMSALTLVMSRHR